MTVGNAEVYTVVDECTGFATPITMCMTGQYTEFTSPHLSAYILPHPIYYHIHDAILLQDTYIIMSINVWGQPRA